jgi:nitric oxide reductase NorD protein
VIYSAETNKEIEPFTESAMPEELESFTTKNLKLFLQKLNQKYPAFEAISKNFREPLFLEAFGYPPRTKNSSAAGPEDDAMLHTPSKGQEIKGKTAPKAELKKTESKDENPLVHTFEKVHTLEEYHGGSKRTDGANEMEEHEEALKELELKYVIRSPEQTDSVFKSDALVEAQETILKDPLNLPVGKIFKYPEWNEKEKGYRQNWVTLHEYELPALRKATAVQSLAVKNLKHKWELLVNEMHWQKKCKDGSEIDLNAYLTGWAGWQKNGQELTRIYEQKIKLNRDVAIGVLIDLSLSTDSYVNGVRIFDLVTQSLEIFAQSMDQLIEQVCLGGFFSETRQKVSYLNLKDFKEPYSAYQNRTGWLKPTGYTRLVRF